MAKEIGLWIDHHKAVIVTIENDIGKTQEVRSNIDRSNRLSSGSHVKDREHNHHTTPEEKLIGPIANYLGKFLEGVVSFLREADSIWIIGPGLSKTELEKLIRKTDLGKSIVGVETADKMTNSQVKTLVLEYYGH